MAVIADRWQTDSVCVRVCVRACVCVLVRARFRARVCVCAPDHGGGGPELSYLHPPLPALTYNCTQVGLGRHQRYFNGG